MDLMVLFIYLQKKSIDLKSLLQHNSKASVLQHLAFFMVVNYKLLPRALPKTEQQKNLPSASTEIEPHAAIALTFNKPWGSSGSSEALFTPGTLEGQAFR